MESTLLSAEMLGTVCVIPIFMTRQFIQVVFALGASSFTQSMYGQVGLAAIAATVQRSGGSIAHPADVLNTKLEVGILQQMSPCASSYEEPLYKCNTGVKC